MEWTDRAIVLSARRHGESAAIVQLMTENNGRHAGLVRGGWGRRQRGVLQPGNRVEAHWRARLADHLGACRCELVASPAVAWFDDPGRLAGLASACALVEAALPERLPLAQIHADLDQLLDALADDAWLAAYVHWEVALLAELGYGLDLSECAATGVNDGLIYVSPRTGRAVSAAAGEPYAAKLLALPGFLLDASDDSADARALVDGLALTGHFLSRHVFAGADGRLPAARARLADRAGAKAPLD